jgi:hypothetical protein
LPTTGPRFDALEENATYRPLADTLGCWVGPFGSTLGEATLTVVAAHAVAAFHASKATVPVSSPSVKCPRQRFKELLMKRLTRR